MLAQKKDRGGADDRSPSKTRRILERAGNVPGSERYQWFPPINWVAEMVQYLVVILILAIANMFRLMFRKQKPHSSRYGK